MIWKGKARFEIGLGCNRYDKVEGRIVSGWE
jgi:hypothetical protein